MPLLICCKSGSNEKQSIIFYSYAEDPGEVHYLIPMVESIRAFTGKYKNAAVWVYMSPDLNNLEPNELILLSDNINYPVFFREMFGARKDFHDITEVITFRHESYFDNPDPEWDKKLLGPEDKINWIREHLAK